MKHSLSSGAVLIELPNYKSPAKPSPLVVAEPRKHPAVGFSAAPRVYWISNDSRRAEIRGGHYHPEGGKTEIVACPMGAIQVRLVSASGEDEFSLWDPSLGLYIPNMVWHELVVGPRSVLLSIVSTEHDPMEGVTDLPPGCG